MADKEIGLNIPVSAVADKDSAKIALNELTKSVLSSLKDGYIEVPAEIKASYTRGSKELEKAQKDVIKSYEKMSKEGFSSSIEELDELIGKYKKFKSLAGKEGKANSKQTKWLTKTIGETLQPYLTQKRELEKVIAGFEASVAKVEKTTKKTNIKKPRNLGPHSKEEIDANIKQHKNRQYKGVESTGPRGLKTTSGIDAGRTNEHLARLSEYSAHGSNWANELAKTLNEEKAKAAKTLVTYIDPSYAKNTKGGRATTEQEFLTDTIKSVRTQLRKAIIELEAGSEDVTLDTLKEHAAVIKVLNSELGKTTEDTMKMINNVIQKQYTQSEKKRLGGTSLAEGQEKGVGPGHENTQALVSQLFKSMKQWDAEVVSERIAKEIFLANNKTTSQKVSSDKNSLANKKIEEIKNQQQQTNSKLEKQVSTTKDATSATEKQTNYDKIENVAERVADSNEQKINKQNSDINRDTARAVKRDAVTGFNTDTKADELINTIEKNNETELPDDVVNILQSILSQITTISKAVVPQGATGGKKYKITKKKNSQLSREDYSLEMKAVYAEIESAFAPIKNALVPLKDSVKTSSETPKAVSKAEFDKISSKLAEEQTKVKVSKSTVYASPFKQSIFKKLETVFESLTGTTKKYEKILQANADEQDAMAAERVRKYGLSKNPDSTGDIASMRRALQMYRTNKAGIESNPDLMQKIKLTPGRKVDTTEMTKSLNKALSGRGMQNAQNGGGFWKNMFGFGTAGLGYAFLPSLEKTRAQADGINQVFGNINTKLQTTLNNIQIYEDRLAGMEASGDVKFNEEGYIEKGTSAAYKTLADLEEEKLILDTIQADLLANDEIIKKTGGRFSSLVKHLNFTSPVLKENNGILRNINSGLDKNGKALKFQTRLAEILNYTYQLMSRSIGQMIKNWLTMLNPIKLIKKAFSDFGSYDVKWQRTMNVIKINFQRIIKPAMEWIAQKLVNIIGFFDIISQRIQAAFGQIPISLFDQAGAEAEQIRRNLEEAANVSLGFDEFHDIGTDQSGANDLTGEIYTPQLSQDWTNLATKIGDTLGSLFNGDMGFGEACGTILKLLGELLAKIGKAIWDWFKTTAIGEYITEHWKDILKTVLALFIGWKLLKVAGKLLFNALFGKLTLSSIAGVFNKIGGWIITLLGASGFGQGIMLAFQSLFAGGKYSLIGTLGEMFTNSAAITQAGSWGSMIGFALVKGLVGVLSIALGGKMVTDAFDSAADKTSYNIGLEQSGGNEEDKKGIGGDVLKGAAGGAAIGFGIGQIVPVIGPLVGAAVGAVAGALVTSLAPAFEAVEVASRNANNEMQKMEYYEGLVQGYSTEVNSFTELLDLSNEALQTQTDKVYSLGEKYGVSKTTLDGLVQSIKDGNYNTEMAAGLNGELAGALEQLDWHYTNNAGLTDKLTEAKRKLQKAEMDLAIAEDIAAGNFELAAARIEVAYASNIYTADEATAKMVQIAKEGSAEQAAAILQDLSPDLQKKFQSEYSTTEKGLNELTDLYFDYSKDEREYFLQNLTGEVQEEMQERVDAIKQAVENAPWWQRLLDIGNDGKILGHTYIDVPGYAVGTNYVPNDGLAYLHKGEAVIPAKYNEGVSIQGKAYQEQAVVNNQLITAVERLEATMKQGITVQGQFIQKGNDLVATVEKVNNKQRNNILSNRVYAR